MAPSRTRNNDSGAQSPADVSASEDVEMQDQETSGNGFAVSAPQLFTHRSTDPLPRRGGSFTRLLLLT